MKIKMHLFWRPILPVPLYGSEMWTLPKSDKNKLEVFLLQAVTNFGNIPLRLPLNVKEGHQFKTHDWRGNPEMKVVMVRPHVKDKRQLATTDTSLEKAAHRGKSTAISTKKDTV